MTYAISSFSWKGLIFLLLMAIVPGGLIYLAMKALGEGNPLPWAVGVSLLVAPLYAFLFVQMFLVKAVIKPSTLAVGGGLYKIEVPFSAMRLDQARISSSAAEAPQLYLRTNGIGMPGLSLGWFKISNRKVFAAVSSPERTIYIPTDLDYDVVVSPREPQAFLDRVIEAKSRNGR